MSLEGPQTRPGDEFGYTRDTRNLGTRRTTVNGIGAVVLLRSRDLVLYPL